MLDHSLSVERTKKPHKHTVMKQKKGTWENQAWWPVLPQLISSRENRREDKSLNKNNG